MNLRKSLLTGAVTIPLLAACTSGGGNVTSVPTSQRSGQGWVITRPLLAAKLLQACADGGVAAQVEDFFAPSRAMIEQLEAQVPSLFQAPQLPDMDRQYVGIMLAGKRQVYLRAVPAHDHHLHSAAQHPEPNCNTGLESVFDPATNTFHHLRRFDQAGQTAH